jgi:hypothetical protein
MRSTDTGASILARGVRKFAATKTEYEDAVGFHVVEDNNDEWKIVTEREVDFRRHPVGDRRAIPENLRWW